MIEDLRADCPYEVFDYGKLMSHLQGYRKPHDKISRLLNAKAIVRVKKGLYVFGPRYQRGPINRYHLANLILGPSYVSQRSALAYHGLIPERVDSIVSMSTKRPKSFDTELGRFRYVHLSPKRFQLGIQQVQEGDAPSFLIASPEKALADLCFQERDLAGVDELYEVLVESLRIEDEALRELDVTLMQEIAEGYRNPGVKLLNRLTQDLSR